MVSAKVYNVCHRRADKVTGLSKGKYLKLDPEYQRDVVWDETRASALIASILRESHYNPLQIL
jgi:uncharacterized protein with ParB-like and HNH nuclease domain